MAIAVACPSCGARMEYKDDDVGRAGQCPTCRAEIRVPLDTKPCVGCRRQVAADATICPACGVALVPGAAATPYSPPTAPPGVTGEAGTSGKAIASLVLGLLSFVLTCITGIPAIILGAMALGDIRRSFGRLTGRGMAITGIVIGSLTAVIGMLTIPIGLLLPAVQQAREAARRTQCRNNLKQIGLAMHHYHDAWGSFPPVATYDAAGRPLLSWRVLLLPYLEETGLYNQFHLAEPWDSPHNLALASQVPQVFRCPSHPMSSPNATCYMAISGAGTIFPPQRTVGVRDITDGTANTAMVAEVASSTIVWSQPGDVIFDATFQGPGNFKSFHPGGWNMLLADGQVRFISDSVDRRVLRAMMTIQGGEQVNLGGQ